MSDPFFAEFPNREPESRSGASPCEVRRKSETRLRASFPLLSPFLHREERDEWADVR